MNAAQLLANFDRLAEAPGAVPRLRRFILDLAVRGKLVEQDAGDEPAARLLKRIQLEKARLVQRGAVKASKPIEGADHPDSSLIPNTWKWSCLAEVGFISPGDAGGPACAPAATVGHTIFYVRDNGIGIDARCKDRVFEIFKRLHAQDAYGGGSGAGLTIARKMVEQHGGRIWFDSQPGQGSTFYFTLPGPKSLDADAHAA